MPFTGFHNLQRITNNTGKIIPSQTPADEIIFSYAFQIDCSDITGFNLEVITVGADFVLSDAAGNEILAWNFRVTYLAGNDVFGFVYYATKEVVTQTFPVPPALTLGDPNGTVLTGGGYGPTGAQIIFDGFESPIFKVKVPNGSTVKITFHNAGFPYLIDLASLTVSTHLGGSSWISGFRHAADGEAVLLYAGQTDAAQVRAVGRERAIAESSSLAWGADGNGFLLRGAGTSQQIALYASKGNALERVSLNAGADYGDGMTVYTGYTFAGVVRGNDGITALLLNASGAAFVGFRDRSGKWSDPLPITLPAGVKIAAGLLLGGDGGGLDFFWTDSTGSAQHIYSAGGGKVWT